LAALRGSGVTWVKWSILVKLTLGSVTNFIFQGEDHLLDRSEHDIADADIYANPIFATGSAK
jgi:hypothetical protein